MPLKQYEYYVYYEGPVVYARCGTKERVAAAEFADIGKIGDPDYSSGVQQAHDLVQTIVNPNGHGCEHFSKPDSKGRIGFHHEGFTSQISPNCEAFVRKAYLKAGVSL